jgi:hypothetical protein
MTTALSLTFSVTYASDDGTSASSSTSGNKSTFLTSAADAPRSATGESVNNTAATARHVDGPSMIPFLPLVIVQAHDWHFLAATQSPSGGTVRDFRVTFHHVTPLPSFP